MMGRDLRSEGPRPALPSSPFLYPLTDRALAGASQLQMARELVRAGARLLQLRDKKLGDGEFLREARQAVQAARVTAALIIVNDRLDVALLSGAAGVHLGDEDLPVREARWLAGPGLIIGCSTHSLEEALRMADEEVDYVALGPIYPSPSKAGREPVGPEAIRRYKMRSPRPLVAIGGIDRDRVVEVRDAGADGIAVLSAVMRPGRIGPSVEELLGVVKRLRA